MDADELDRTIPIGAAGTFLSLKVWLSAVPDNGAGSDTYDFTLRVNSAGTALTCQTAERVINCQVTANVAVAANDLVCVEVVPANTPAVVSVQWVLTFSPTVDGENIYGAGTGSNALTASGTRFLIPQTFCLTTVATEAGTEFMMPTGGTVDDLYVVLDAAPDNGAGVDRYGFTIRLCNPNCADTLLTLNIDDLDTTGSNSTGINFKAGDRLGLEVTPSNTPAAVGAQWGFVIRPADPEDFILGASPNNNLSTTTEYTSIQGRDAWTTTESDVDGRGETMLLKSMYVRLNGAPGAGTSYTLTARSNAKNTPLAVSILDTQTQVNNTALHWIDSGNELSIRSTVTGTPTARMPIISILATVVADRWQGATLQGATLQ